MRGSCVAGRWRGAAWVILALVGREWTVEGERGEGEAERRGERERDGQQTWNGMREIAVGQMGLAGVDKKTIQLVTNWRKDALLE